MSEESESVLLTFLVVSLLITIFYMMAKKHTPPAPFVIVELDEVISRPEMLFNISAYPAGVQLESQHRSNCEDNPQLTSTTTETASASAS